MLLAATVVWTLALGLLGAHEALLFCAPALLLALPLAFGRYLGEDALEAARTRVAQPRRRPARSISSPALRTVAPLPRGGRLIAAFLATRPPPAAPALT